MKVAFSNIFVTVGTMPDGFPRLIRRIDELASGLGARIVMQIGHTQYEPQHAQWFRFTDSLQPYIQNTDLVISHGAMTVIEAIREGKPVIVVPRRAHYGEHLNDHQVEFAEALAQHPALEVVYDVDGLKEAIGRIGHEAGDFQFDDSNRIRLVSKLREFVQEISK